MPRPVEELFADIVSGGKASPRLLALRAGARAASWLYGLGARAQNAGYDFGLRNSPPPAPPR